MCLLYECLRDAKETKYLYFSLCTQSSNIILKTSWITLDYKLFNVCIIIIILSVNRCILSVSAIYILHGDLNVIFKSYISLQVFFPFIL